MTDPTILTEVVVPTLLGLARVMFYVCGSIAILTAARCG